MRIIVVASLLFLSQGTGATVVEMEIPAERVMEVYEEMREEQEAPDNGWIHEFENESLGPEMDHMGSLKKLNNKGISNE